MTGHSGNSLTNRCGSDEKRQQPESQFQTVAFHAITLPLRNRLAFVQSTVYTIFLPQINNLRIRFSSTRTPLRCREEWGKFVINFNMPAPRHIFRVEDVIEEACDAY
jgi:hypothetical protein